MKQYIAFLIASIFIISGCSKSGERDVPTSPTPAFTFTKTPVLPITASFISAGSGANPIVGYLWNFGDPASGVDNTASIQNPIHQYYAEGTYTITLTTVDNTGVVESYTQALSATLRPGNVAPASFTFSTSPSFLVTFTNNSTNATSYKWMFGDGMEMLNDSATVHHYYFSPGTYHVSLIANGTSASDTLTLPVTLP